MNDQFYIYETDAGEFIVVHGPDAARTVEQQNPELLPCGAIAAKIWLERFLNHPGERGQMIRELQGKK